MTVAQDVKTLKVDQSVSTRMGDQKAALAINLDASPSKNTVAAQGMSIDLAATAAWEGAALVVKTAADIQGQTMVSTERWTLDAATSTGSRRIAARPRTGARARRRTPASRRSTTSS